MNATNLPQLELKADLTKTVENAYDDTLKQPLQSSSNAVTTLVNFFHNTVLYPMQKYNLYAKDKLQNYANELENRAKAIPSENLISPRVNILGPAIDGLKYNLDEEHIKEMFTNILLSEMNNKQQKKVLPSYIEIVKQLSRDDAKLLKFIKDNELSSEPIIKLKINFSDGGHATPSDDLLLIIKEEYKLIPAIIIDNLSRLKIIEIDFMNFRYDQSLYDKAFQRIKSETPMGMISSPSQKLDYSKGMLKVTDYGKNLIDICLS